MVLVYVRKKLIKKARRSLLKDINDLLVCKLSINCAFIFLYRKRSPGSNSICRFPKFDSQNFPEFAPIE